MAHLLAPAARVLLLESEAAAPGCYGIQSSPGVGALCAALLLGRPVPAGLAQEGVDPAQLAPRRARSGASSAG